MDITRVNMNMFTTKKSAKRSDVWRKFLELRAAGKEPVLLDTAASAGGRSLIFVPSAQGGAEDFSSEKDAAWVGFHTYDQGLEWLGISSKQKARLPKTWGRFCSEVYEFEVATEDASGRESDRESQNDFSMGEISSGISKQEYLEALAKIKQKLHDGETYQVNFAQELRADFRGDPFAFYAAMFNANPSAMCFFAEGLGDDGEPFAVCSNSPERLFSLKTGDDGRAIIRTEPIKGTVARDEDPQFLLRDEKSYAELTMIVDLVRNDFGKVAKSGSVEVLEHQALMELSHVWHTYSVVEAELAEGKTAADVLRAVFPGGSITGCPKHRTMQIIDQLENFTRGAYCGSAGYILPSRDGWPGEADFNIMIRTATVQGGEVRFPVGGAIVWDSMPEAEFKETWDKAGVFVSIRKSA